VSIAGVRGANRDAFRRHRIFRFKDGSLYDETVTFSQRNVFRLLSYRLVQRGKSFPAASETSFDRNTGRYQVHSGTGNEKRTEGTLDLPEENLPSGTNATGHLLAFTPKPRLLKSELRAEGGDKYFVGDMAHNATRYLIKLEIGGLAGRVAGWLGKVPPELRY
jgi:hypothetical protein